MSARSMVRRSVTPSSLVCAVALLAVVARRGHAQQQQAPVLPPDGSYVRVLLSNGWQVGTLLQSRRDTVSLAICCGGSRETIPLDSIRAMDVSQGRAAPAKNVLAGLVIGMVGGTGIAYLAGSAACRAQPNTDGPPCELGIPILMGGGALVGLVVGGIIGMHVGKRELWRPVRLRVSVAPDPRSGLRLGLAIPLR